MQSRPVATGVPSAPPASAVRVAATSTALATVTTPAVAAAGERLDPLLLRPAVHVWQKWNNCGPSAALMAMSVFGVDHDQLALAARLKPDREDTNVTPDEIAGLVRSEGLGALVRHGGSVDLVRSLLAVGAPVIAEQWIDVEGRGEMGHYRVAINYDDRSGEVVTQDSFYGPNRRYDRASFERMWAPFSGAYVVVYDPAREAEVMSALGADRDEAVNADRVAAANEARVAAEPHDAWAHFALGEALSRTGRHEQALAAFDRAVAIGLPTRAFWYQFGLYRSLYAAGAYDRIVAHADVTLATMNGENLEESRYWRGMALRALDREDEARVEFETALVYNPLFAAAAEALTAGR